MLRVRDIMTTDLTVVSPQTTLREAMELLARRHVSGAPVVSGKTLVGVVSAADLLAFAATTSGVPAQRDDDLVAAACCNVSEAANEPVDEAPTGGFFSEMWASAGANVPERITAFQLPEWNALDDHDVSEVMTRVVWSLPSSAGVREAADLMCDCSIHRVLVVDRGDLAGIVSALDIVRAIAERKLPSRAYVFNRDADFR